MMPRTCAVGSVVLLLTAGASFAQTPPREALQNLRSVHYAVASTLEMTGEGLTGKSHETTMAFLSPGKARIETSAPMGRLLTISRMC